MRLCLLVPVVDEALVFDGSVRAEVDQQSETLAGGFEVVDGLSAVLVCQGSDGLDLDDDFTETEEIRLIGLSELLALVLKFQLRLGDERDILALEFDRKAFVVYAFEKTVSVCVPFFL